MVANFEPARNPSEDPLMILAHRISLALSLLGHREANADLVDKVRLVLLGASITDLVEIERGD